MSKSYHDSTEKRSKNRFLQESLIIKGNLVRKFALIILTLLAVIFALTFTPLTAPASAPVLSGLPQFKFDRVLLQPEALHFNPTGEIIFPSVIEASDYFSHTLGTYYLYYAPHDKPGGINLAYSNSLDGPWLEYDNNPIISHDWPPHYTVSHVSSPHALWVEDEAELYLYFHGENSVTRLARSTDGINFTYDSRVISTDDFKNISEASYARVFEYTIPSKNNKYIMLLMGNNGGSRKIYLAWSDNAKTWTTQPEPIISPTGAERPDIAGPFFYPWQDNYYVVYHAASGQIFVTEVGANFDRENHLGLFYQDLAGIRAASPYFYTAGETQYMFYNRGSRGHTSIAVAKSKPEVAD